MENIYYETYYTKWFLFEQYFTYIQTGESYFNCIIETQLVQNKHFKFDVYSASSLKQQFGAGRHFPLWEHCPVIQFLLLLGGKAVNTNLLFLFTDFIFGLTRSGIEPTIFRTQSECVNHYVHDRVGFGFMVLNATFNNISVILWRSDSFIGGGNRSIRRKLPTCRKSDRVG
jgi:hypothetical protein